jgi:hypothetical protein
MKISIVFVDLVTILFAIFVSILYFLKNTVFLVAAFQFPFSYLKITYSKMKNEMKAQFIPTKKCMFFYHLPH